MGDPAGVALLPPKVESQLVVSLVTRGPEAASAARSPGGSQKAAESLSPLKREINTSLKFSILTSELLTLTKNSSGGDALSVLLLGLDMQCVQSVNAKRLETWQPCSAPTNRPDPLRPSTSS